MGSERRSFHVARSVGSYLRATFVSTIAKLVQARRCVNAGRGNCGRHRQCLPQPNGYFPGPFARTAFTWSAVISRPWLPHEERSWLAISATSASLSADPNGGIALG